MDVGYRYLWLHAFVLTLLCELPLVLLLARGRARAVRVGAAALVGNAITHPMLCLVLLVWFGGHGTWAVGLVLGEAFALAGEAVAYRIVGGTPWRLAWTLSLAANAYSLAVGEWVHRVVLPGYLVTVIQQLARRAH